ncbi:NAD-dependent epimerase/dehydratase family protein [Roseixanthobacter glucoisosaccharinicivorans]|uniref:NAD-dependent epimerase/dehydratase family protein n=1 Tax=Roseixanthobacter glucoisosaccharinicivorans TaxID=3119923 RepID=UPI00372A4F9D
MRILVTGTAGFIGFHLARLLLRSGHEIAGVDGLTPYYDVSLKRRREALLLQNAGFTAHEVMLEDSLALNAIAEAFQPEAIIHLAAQAGVRYSLENPRSYVEANLVGTFNVMELARVHAVKHFMLASTSSVYGANTLMPFVEDERTDFPLTLYAATKKATEVMSHSYAHLWGIPTTAFRFFTVYGPWGRPDMALFKFTRCMLRGEPIDVYNHGDMYRDFTYVDDLVKAVALLLDAAPARGSANESDDSLGTSPAAPFRVVNIGKGSPVRLLDFIEEIERCVGRPAIRNYMPMQPGDVPNTYANVDLLERLTGYRPDTDVAAGVAAFVAWYKDYYGC